MADRKKTLLVGLDAACWGYFRPLLEAGELPALQALLDRGIAGTLRSTLPALTPTAWASLVTGKNPGKHGVFDITKRVPGSYEFIPINAQMRMGTPFWKRLNEQGIRVGLVNVPFTYPTGTIDGFIVPGFGAPASVPDLVYPPKAMTQVEDVVGRYQPAVPAELLRSDRYLEMMAAEEELQANHIRIAARLSREYVVDVLVINLMLLDHVNHKVPDMTLVNQAIRRLDADLAALIDAFHPDNIMVISDHGSRRVKGDFLLHAWLRDHGYAWQMPRSRRARDDALNWILRQWLRLKVGQPDLGEKVLRHLARWALSNLPAGLVDPIWHRLDQDIPFAREHVVFDERLDFDQTLVYPGASYSSLLYFNRQGREPQGIVGQEKQRQLTEELRERLKALADPETGEPLFTAVYAAESLFDGPATEEAPDLIIDSYQSAWNTLCTFRRGSFAEGRHGRYFVNNSKDHGHHSRDGIFVCAGQDFARGQLARPQDLVDITATLLYLYGVPIPEDFDSRPIVDLIGAETRKDVPIRFQAGDDEMTMYGDELYSEDEVEEIVSHLRALGYVE